MLSVILLKDDDEFCLFMGRFRGAIGSSLRYFVGKMMPSKFLMFESFPLGTFSVNIIGCFVIGFMGHLAVKKVFGDDFGIFFVTGVLGVLRPFLLMG